MTSPFQLAQVPPASKNTESPCYRAILVGAGVMGKRHLNALQASAHARICAIYDPRLPSDLGLPSDHAAMHVHNRDEFCRCLENADFAVIAADTSQHLSVTLDALNAGVACLLEKPATGSIAQCTRIIEESRSRKVKVAVAQVERFNTAVIEAESHFREQRWRKIQFTRLNPLSARMKHQSLVYDLMVHDVDLALHVFKQRAHGPCRIVAHGYDANGIAYICIQYASVDAVKVEICCGRLAGANVRQIRACGDAIECHADLLRQSIDLQDATLAQRRLAECDIADALGSQLQEFICFLSTGSIGRLATLDSALASLSMCAEIEALAARNPLNSISFDTVL